MVRPFYCFSHEFDLLINNLILSNDQMDTTGADIDMSSLKSALTTTSLSHQVHLKNNRKELKQPRKLRQKRN